MRTVLEREFVSFDGVPLFYRHWPLHDAAATGTPKAVVLLHRGHEHSGRVMHLAEELDMPDAQFFAWDARGNGRSPGVRGDAPGFEALVRDLDSFIAHLRATHGIAVQDIVVIAQSVGAVVAATWVHDYAPPLRALVLASPAFKVKLYVPFARPGLALLHALRGNFFVNSYVKPQWLTHDPARVESYRTDPLITRPISVRVLLGLYAAADRVVDDAQAITVPTQLLVSGADFVVHRGPQDRFYENLRSPIKPRHWLPGSSTTPWANAIARWPSRTFASSSRRVLRNRRCAPRWAMHTVPGPVSKRPNGWPGRRSAIACRTCAGVACVPACAWVAGSPRASRLVCRPVSIPAAHWITSTAIRRVVAGRWGA